MRRTSSKKKSSEGASSDTDADHSNSEGDKLAIRRARNKEAARRVRERRMNAIKRLSEQVEQLVGENQELRDKLEAAEEGKARESNTPCPAVSVTRAGTSQIQQEVPKRPDTRNVSVQTDATEPTVKSEPAASAAEQQQQLWSPVLQELQEEEQQQPQPHLPPSQQQQPAGTCQDLAVYEQLQQHVLLPPAAAAAAAATQNPALFSLQQMRLLVQMQMQLLQLQGSASPASGMQMPNIMDQQPSAQHAAANSRIQAAAGGAWNSPYNVAAAAAAAGIPVPAAAWTAVLQQHQSLQQSQAQQPLQQQQQQQQQNPAQLSKWGYVADTAQSSRAAPSQQQQQQQPSAVPPLPPLPERQQQQPQQPLQQAPMHAAPPLQQRQQPTVKPAAGADDPPADETRFAPIPEDHVLCQLGVDDVMLMSTDLSLNINTGDLNTADLNCSNSGFNTMMMASEELLRHVPTPEEATASRSTAWL